MFTTYLFPFEITSALLVIAVVGAVVLARRPGSALGPPRPSSTRPPPATESANARPTTAPRPPAADGAEPADAGPAGEDGAGALADDSAESEEVSP